MLSAGEVRTTRTLVSGASISWASRLDPAVAGAGATMITNDVGSVNGVAPFLRWRVSAGLLWRLDGAQDVYVNLIQADGAATAAEQALMQWTGIQTGVLQALRYFWIRGQGSRNNTTDTVTARFRLGTAGTSADAIIHASTNTGLTGTQRSLALEYVAAAVAATTIRTISTANGPTGAAFPGTANGSPAPQQFTVNDMGATTSILSASLQPAATATIPTFNHLIISGY